MSLETFQVTQADSLIRHLSLTVLEDTGGRQPGHVLLGPGHPM